MVKPDSERLRPLRELPVPHNAKSLKWTLGLFAYYAKGVKGFYDKIERHENATSFPLQPEVIPTFCELETKHCKCLTVPY